jgi:hypothetical protein
MALVSAAVPRGEAAASMLIPAALLCAIGGVGLQLVAGPVITVGGTVHTDLRGRCVTLSRVHPGFADAVRRRYGPDRVP